MAIERSLGVSVGTWVTEWEGHLRTTFDFAGNPRYLSSPSLSNVFSQRSSCDEICGTIGLSVIPVPDPGDVFSSSQVYVAILRASQSLVRHLKDGETRESLCTEAKKDILDAKVAIPSPLMSLLDDPKRLRATAAAE